MIKIEKLHKKSECYDLYKGKFLNKNVIIKTTNSKEWSSKQFNEDLKILKIVSVFPCFLQHHGVFRISDEKFFPKKTEVVLYEFSERGNYKDYIENSKGLNDESTSSLLKDICYGISMIHDFFDKSLWLDIKMENILIFNDGSSLTAKFCDTKFRREDSQIPSNKLSLNPFIAPETFEEIERRKKTSIIFPEFGNIYTKESNIYCLGKIIEHSFVELTEFWKDISQNCCDVNPFQRITIKGILSHFSN